MGEFEEKLASVMNDPAMMEKIAALAQSLGNADSEKQHNTPPPKESSVFPEMDMNMLQKLSGFAKQSGIDQNKQNLLRALSPYISSNRIAKLERAMRAAKLAGFATNLLGR